MNGEMKMYEIMQFARLKKGNMAPAIIECPNGKFEIVSSIPEELTRVVKSGFTITKVSILFDTEQEAINALLELGITRFQLNNCEWYDN